MHYINLRKSLKGFTIFSLSDIESVAKNFHRRRLNDWQDKGYIKKIIKGYYIFSDLDLDENVLFEIANRIYSPSYVSLEMALSYYDLVPEAVYATTSVSTRKTYRFKTSIGEFVYKTIKPKLFFGYNIVSYDNKNFKIASMEKTILDYFYINPDLKTKADFSSLRINKDIFLKELNEEKLYTFLEKFTQKSLEKRIRKFMEFMKNA